MGSCKRADRWVAALQAGTLDDADRIRLRDHLQRCEKCRQRADRIATVVELLRKPPPLSRTRRDAMWRAVSDGLRADPVVTPAPGHRVRSLLAAAAAILAVGLGLWLMDDDDQRKPQTVTALGPGGGQRPPAARLPSDPRRPQSPPEPVVAWTVADSRAATDQQGAPLRPGVALGSGDTIEVPRGGRAVLRSASRTVFAQPGSRLSIAASAAERVVRLEEGQVVIAGHGRRGQPRFVVEVGSLRVVPRGTVFSVSANGPRVAVLEGAVEILQEDQRRILRAGWTQMDTRPPSVLADTLAREMQQMIRMPQAAGPLSQPEAERHERGAAQTQDRRVGQKRHEKRAKQPATGDSASPSSMTLVAESHLQRGEYRQARDAYLALWRAHPRHPLGSDGLFMAASLTLQKTGQPARAVRLLDRYLRDYTHGRQREGAFFMQHTALRRQGNGARASAVASRYAAEYPAGNYRSLMKSQ